MDMPTKVFWHWGLDLWGGLGFGAVTWRSVSFIQQKSITFATKLITCITNY